MKPGVRKIAWGLVYLYAALLTAFVYLHFTGSMFETLTFYPKASIGSLVTGTGDKPYVGRMLVPLILRGVDAASPDSVKSGVAWVFTNEDFIQDFYGVSASPDKFPYLVAVFCILAVLMYFGVAMGGRAVFLALGGAPGIGANLCGLVYVLACPLWLRYVAYIYDPMTILLATWVLYAAVRANIWLCCIMFVLACINKETAPLLLPVVVYGLYKGRGKIPAYATGLILLVVAVLIHAYRQGRFDTNGGAWMEPHWQDHQSIIFTQYPMSLLYAVIVMGTFLTFALIDFRRKPLILRIGFCFTFIPLFLASIPFGFVDEIRALYDSYPFVLMLAMPTAFAVLGFPGETSSDAGRLGSQPRSQRELVET